MSSSMFPFRVVFSYSSRAVLSNNGFQWDITVEMVGMEKLSNKLGLE